MNNNQIHKARALYYNMFANFFVVPSDVKKYSELIKLIKLIKQNPLDASFNEALEYILNSLHEHSNKVLMQEYDDIFHSPVTKNIPQSASFYDEGYESGRKRVEMINFVAKTKLRRDEKNFYDYEDSVGFIFSFLAKLCDEVALGKSEYENTIHCVFKEILNDFIDEFAKNLYAHESAKIYKNLMVVLHSFIEFERLFLGVSKPNKKEKIIKKENKEEISEEEKQRRARNKELRKKGAKKEQEVCAIDIAYDVEDDI